MAHRLGEINRNHQPDAERTEKICQSSQIRQIILQKQLGRIMHVDVVDTQYIQACRSQ